MLYINIYIYQNIIRYGDYISVFFMHLEINMMYDQYILTSI